MTIALHRIEGDPESPGPPPREAIEFFEAKKLEVTFDHSAWSVEHATAFTAARIMELDVLSDMRDELDRSLREGRSFQSFLRELKPRMAAKGWWGEVELEDPRTGKPKTVNVNPHRLKLIYDTNMRTARAAGQWERIERHARTRPALIYALGPSERHRPEHAALEGMIRPVDDPIWNDIMPPNGYGCKCHVLQATMRAVERRGGYSSDADMRRRVREINRHRKRVQERRDAARKERGLPPDPRPVPMATTVGDAADASFRFNPGMERMKGLRGRAA